jgi:hypothetical protein
MAVGAFGTIMQLLSSNGRTSKTVLAIWIYEDADLDEVADRRNRKWTC